MSALAAEERVPVVTTGAGNPRQIRRHVEGRRAVMVMPVVPAATLAQPPGAGRGRTPSSPRAPKAAAMWAR